MTPSILTNIINMNKVLVTGSNGQLGSEIRQIVTENSINNFLFTDKDELDITDYGSVQKYILQNKVDTIINCAAYTNVDKAEIDFKIANEINHLAVSNLAKISKNNFLKLIHISTDYVFDGNLSRSYAETDNPTPQTVYGQTKLDGELAIIQINPVNSIIIRTSWLYSKYGKNFVKTMLKISKEKDEIRVVDDQIGSPTNAQNLAKAIIEIHQNIKNKKVEIYHYSNSGRCSWYEFAKNIFRIKNIDINIIPIQSKDFHRLASRPKSSILDNNKIQKQFNLKIVDWKESLINYLNEINE